MSEKRSSKRRVLGHAARVVLGLLVGVGIAELAFYVRDDGAFPHLNVYLEDGGRGVRLKPGATEKIRFSNNPITQVRINSEGFRGGEWPAPAADEAVVVGDSQVFGLGVEENETFASVLSGALGPGHWVRNLGVPTYGPAEYNAVLEESLAKRPAKTVIWVVNLANDLFEATRPNRDRHAVWDGWAVRRETAPASLTQFPGRGLLYTHSHAFYAFRRFLYDRAPKDSEQGSFVSEGTWRDISDVATTAERERAAARDEEKRLAELRAAEIKYADQTASAVQRNLEDKVIAADPPELRDAYTTDEGPNNPDWLPKEQKYRAARLSPGDIVNTRLGESSRDVRVNAEHIRRGAELRLKVEKAQRERALAARDAETVALFDQRDAAEKKLATLRAAPLPKAPPLSPLAPAIRAAKAICDKHGARLLVVALPVDVQVSATEWKKYGAEPLDMSATKVLLEDVVYAARDAGAEGFDATPTLAQAEPGAFLDGDIHMTPKGHKALGEAIAKALKAPRVVMPGDGLPPQRSWPPRPEEWTANTEIGVRESDPAACETKIVREWLGIFCRSKGSPTGVVVDAGKEVMAGSVPGNTMLVAPLFKGQAIKATFSYPGSTRELVVSVPEDAGTAQIAFSKPLAAATRTASAVDAGPLCACFAKVNAGASCSKATMVPDADCARTYPDDCQKLVACAAGDPNAPPKCAEGQANVGASHRCRALCSEETPCERGTCSSWQGGRVCM